MKIMKKGLALLLVAVLLFSFAACGKKDDTTAKSAQFQSLREYAAQLEKSGNSEAAAAVYEQIAKGGGELIQKAHDDSSAIWKADEALQMEEIFDHTKGGDGK